MGILSTVASFAAPVLGGIFSSRASRDASDSQAQATMEGIRSQERMFERGLQLQEPFREAGYGAISGLQGLMDPSMRASMLTDYYNSAEFQGYQQQAEEAALRNAAATGNLRGGVTQQALASIAPQLGSSFLANNQNILTGLGNLGIGAASQASGQANQLGANIAMGQQRIGDIQAQNALTQANIFGNALGGISGLIQDKWG